MLIEADYVHIAFDHNEVARALALLPVEAIEVVALVEDGRISCVEVFWRFIPHRPRTKADHPACGGNDGEDDPVTVSVVHAAFFAANGQPGLHQRFFGNALRLHVQRQVVPSGWRVAQAEGLQHRRIHPPADQVLPGPGAPLAKQLAYIEAGGLLAGRVKPLLLHALFAQALVVDLLGQFHAGALGQALNGFGIGELFSFHHELDDPASRVAAKAIIELIIRRNGERRRLFAMEGAAAPQPAAIGL